MWSKLSNQKASLLMVGIEPCIIKVGSHRFANCATISAFATKHYYFFVQAFILKTYFFLHQILAQLTTMRRILLFTIRILKRICPKLIFL